MLPAPMASLTALGFARALTPMVMVVSETPSRDLAADPDGPPSVPAPAPGAAWPSSSALEPVTGPADCDPDCALETEPALPVPADIAPESSTAAPRAPARGAVDPQAAASARAGSSN